MRRLKGVLIVNGYMRTEKFEEITELYRQAAKQKEIILAVKYTDTITYGIAKGCAYNSLLDELETIDFVLFLDKDIHLARNLERLGVRVFNASHVIEVCDNKALTFEALSNQNIPMPETIIAPLVYQGTYKAVDSDYIKNISSRLGFPLVIKESFGSFGEQVYLVHNEEELTQKRLELCEKPHIYQKFVASSRGRDVRINVVGDQVVASMLRSSETDFRANVTNGGRMTKWDVDPAFEALAIKVCGILGADFAGVDLLFGEKGEPILCEVNSNAHIKNILMCTGVNVAEAIMSYMIKVCQND